MSKRKKTPEELKSDREFRALIGGIAGGFGGDYVGEGALRYAKGGKKLHWAPRLAAGMVGGTIGSGVGAAVGAKTAPKEKVARRVEGGWSWTVPEQKQMDLFNEHNRRSQGLPEKLQPLYWKAAAKDPRWKRYAKEIDAIYEKRGVTKTASLSMNAMVKTSGAGAEKYEPDALDRLSTAGNRSLAGTVTGGLVGALGGGLTTRSLAGAQAGAGAGGAIGGSLGLAHGAVAPASRKKKAADRKQYLKKFLKDKEKRAGAGAAKAAVKGLALVGVGLGAGLGIKPKQPKRRRDPYARYRTKYAAQETPRQRWMKANEEFGNTFDETSLRDPDRRAKLVKADLKLRDEHDRYRHDIGKKGRRKGTVGAATLGAVGGGLIFAPLGPKAALKGALGTGAGLGAISALTQRAAAKRHKKRMQKTAMPFLKQDRPEKVKEIYRALVRDHPEYSAEKKARIASAKGKEKVAFIFQAIKKQPLNLKQTASLEKKRRGVLGQREEEKKEKRAFLIPTPPSILGF